MQSINDKLSVEKTHIFGGVSLALLSGYAYGFTPKGFIAPPVTFAYASAAYNTLKATLKDEKLNTSQKAKKVAIIIFFSLASCFSLIYLCPILYKKSFVLTSSSLFCLSIISLAYWTKWNKEFNIEVSQFIKGQTSPTSHNEIAEQIKEKKGELFYNFHLLTSLALLACSISFIAFKILRPNY